MCDNTLYEPADIIIYVQGEGIVVKEKSFLAYRKRDNKIVAIGTEAGTAVWRESEDVMVISPFRQGMIADYTVAEVLLSYLLTKALGKRSFFRRRPAIVICVPKGATPMEKAAFRDALIQARAGEVFITETPMDQFIREFPEKFPEEYRKFRVIVGITKEEPERYVEEKFGEILTYAAQESISQEKVYGLLQKSEGAGDEGGR